MHKIKLLLTIAVIFALTSGVVIAKQMSGSSDTKSTSPSIAHSKSKGSEDAEIKIVEFVDFQCHSCRNASKLIKNYMDHYPGKVSVELKYFPLRGHTHSIPSAMVVECSRLQGKFWPVHDAVFETQDEWRVMTNANQYLADIAVASGANKTQLYACLESEAVMQTLSKERSEALSKGLRSTPSFYVNDELEVGFKALKRKLEELLGPLPQEDTSE